MLHFEVETERGYIYISIYIYINICDGTKVTIDIVAAASPIAACCRPDFLNGFRKSRLESHPMLRAVSLPVPLLVSLRLPPVKLSACSSAIVSFLSSLRQAE